MREKPLSTIRCSTSPGGVSTSRAKIFGRGTMTFLHRRLRELEDAVDQLLLGLVEHALLAPLGDQVLDLLLGDERRGGRCRGCRKTAQHGARGGGQDRRPARARRGARHVERRRHQQGDGVGEAEGQRLGHQLAQDQLDVDDPAARPRRWPPWSGGRTGATAARAPAPARRSGWPGSRRATPASVPIRVTPIWTVARKPSMSSCSALSRRAALPALGDQRLDPAPPRGDDGDLGSRRRTRCRAGRSRSRRSARRHRPLARRCYQVAASPCLAPPLWW